MQKEAVIKRFYCGQTALGGDLIRSFAPGGRITASSGAPRGTAASGYYKVMESSMDEVIKIVAQKAGISEEQAKTAVTTVADFLKKKLPEPMAGHVDDLLSMDISPDVIGKIESGLGGLFGKK